MNFIDVDDIAFEDVQDTNELVFEDVEFEDVEQTGLLDRFKRGFSQRSATGYLKGEGLSNQDIERIQQVEGDPTFWQSLFESGGEMLGDLPFNYAGLKLGAAAGGSLGAPIGPLGSAITGTLGGGFGAFAIPSALKAAFREYKSYYDQGGDQSFGEFLSEKGASLGIETLKSGVTGAALSMIRPLLPVAASYSPFLKNLLTYKPVREGAAIALEGATGAILPAALEGKLPGPKELAEAVTLTAAFSALMKLPKFKKMSGKARDGLMDVLGKESPETLNKLLQLSNDVTIDVDPNTGEVKSSNLPESKFATALETILDNAEKKAGKVEEAGGRKLLEIEKKFTQKAEQIAQNVDAKTNKQSEELETRASELQEEAKSLDAEAEKALDKSLKLTETLKTERSTSPEKTALEKKISKTKADLDSLSKRYADVEKKRAAISEKIGKKGDKYDLETEKQYQKDLKEAEKFSSDERKYQSLLSEAERKKYLRENSFRREAVPDLVSKQEALDKRLQELKEERRKLESALRMQNSDLFDLVKEMKEAPFSKRQESLQKQIDKADKSRKEAFEAAREKLREADKLKDQAKLKREESRNLNKAKTSAAIDELKEKKEKAIQKKKDQATRLSNKIREKAKERVEQAKKENVITVKEGELNPNSPTPDRKVKIRYVPTPKEDIGKPERQVIGQHIVSGADKDPWKMPTFEQVKDLIKTKIFDEYSALEKIDPDLKKAAELLRGISGRIEAVLRIADYDLKTMMPNGPAFISIFDPKRVRKLTGKEAFDRKGFDAYLVAATSIERQNIGHLNPIPTDVAMKYLRDNPQFAPFAKDLYDSANRFLQKKVDAGLLSPEAKESMQALYSSYAPLYRFFPVEKTIWQQLTGKKDTAVKKGKTLEPSNTNFRAKGSNRDIYSPTESYIKNVYAFEEAIAKNQFMNRLRSILEKQGYKKAEDTGLQRVSSEKLQELLGDDFEVTPQIEQQLSVMANILDPKTYLPARGKISGFENGKRWEMEVPPEVYEAIKGLVPEQYDVVINMISKVTKDMFSLFTVISPDTLLSIAGLDVVNSTLQSKFPGNPLIELPMNFLVNMPRMIVEVLKKGDLYRDYLLSGAASMGYRGIDRPQLALMADTLTNAEKLPESLEKLELDLTVKGVAKIIGSVSKTAWDSTAGGVIKLLKGVINALKSISNTIGDANRLIEFEKSYIDAIKKGKSRTEAIEQAGFDAYEVSVPFGRKGTSKVLRSLYKMIPFMNTIMNGIVLTAQIANPFNDPARWRRFMITGLAYLTLPTIALYLMNREDDRYRALPQEDRDRETFYYLDDEPDSEPLKVRKVWTYGWLFQTMPEHFVEYALSKDPKAFDGLARSFETEFSPLTMLNFTKAISEKDPLALFEGRYRLIPEKQKQMAKEFQAVSNTTQAAKFFGKYLNVSPIYMDFLFNQTGGGFGQDLLRVIDDVAYYTGAAEDNRPSKKLADSIFYGRFFGRGPSKRNAYLNKFYEYYDKFNEVDKSIRYLKEQDREQEYLQYDAIPRVAMQKMNNMRNRIGKFYQQIERVNNAKLEGDYTAEKKRKDLDRLYLELTNTAREYVTDIEEQLRNFKTN